MILSKWHVVSKLITVYKLIHPYVCHIYIYIYTRNTIAYTNAGFGAFAPEFNERTRTPRSTDFRFEFRFQNLFSRENDVGVRTVLNVPWHARVDLLNTRASGVRGPRRR